MTSKVNIHWEEINSADLSFFPDNEEKPPVVMLCVFCYGNGKFTKFHLADRATAEPEFIRMMENRADTEIEYEGWNVKAMEIPLDDNRALVGHIGIELREISDMLLNSLFRDKSGDH